MFNIAHPGNLTTAPQLQQSFHRGLDDVVRVICPKGFGQDVTYSDGLQDSANRSPRRNSSATSSGLEQHATCSIVAQNAVRDGCAGQWDGVQILFGFVYGFPNGFWHLIRFAKPNTNPASTVAYYDKGTETETPAALYDLRHPIHVYDLIDVFGLFSPCFDHPPSFALNIRLRWLKFQAVLTCCRRHSLHTSVIEKTITVKHDTLNALLFGLSCNHFTDKGCSRNITAIYTRSAELFSQTRRRSQNTI